MSALHAISPREASIFACFTDCVVAPGGGLPPVRETDAAFAFDGALEQSPALNRLGLRVALHALELAPLALGMGHRMRGLTPEARTEALARLDGSAALSPLVKALRSLGHLCYYGDAGVLRLLGYDHEAVVRRARALRAQETRW